MRNTALNRPRVNQSSLAGLAVQVHNSFLPSGTQTVDPSERLWKAVLGLPPHAVAGSLTRRLAVFRPPPCPEKCINSRDGSGEPSAQKGLLLPNVDCQLYSCRNASTGSMREAFKAGIIPNVNPTNRVTPNPSTIAIGGI